MPSPDRVAYAHERLAARRRRVRLIRQRVVAGTLAAFVLAWGVVVFDGSMGVPASIVSAQATSTTVTTSSDDAAATMTTSQS
jgi:hypothetical protein